MTAIQKMETNVIETLKKKSDDERLKDMQTKIKSLETVKKGEYEELV